MSMTFYYAPMSSSSRVHWALEELGVPYEKVKVSLKDGDTKKPDFLKLNPNGKIPLLVVDGVPIFESLAQLLYLGETFGVDKGLFPKPGIERAEAFKWMAWVSVSMHDAVSGIIKNGDRFPEDERNEKARERSVREMGGLFKILDDHLSNREYLVGDAFSIVDCSVASLTHFVGRLGVDTNPYKNVHAWSGRCFPRPALARVMQG